MKLKLNDTAADLFFLTAYFALPLYRFRLWNDLFSAHTDREAKKYFNEMAKKQIALRTIIQTKPDAEFPVRFIYKLSQLSESLK